MQLAFGPYEHDVSCRAVVMGIVGRTPDPCRHAGHLVADGAAALDLGAAAGGGEHEELDGVVAMVQTLRARFDVPLAVHTGRSAVVWEACRAGASVAIDRSGFADPHYLAVAAAAGASVMAVFDETAPADVTASLAEQSRRAIAAGVPPPRILLDAGLDGDPRALRHATGPVAALGYPLVLRSDRAGAQALGVVLGVRVLWAHDVKAARRVADVLAAVVAARGTV